MSSELKKGLKKLFRNTMRADITPTITYLHTLKDSSLTEEDLDKKKDYLDRFEKLKFPTFADDVKFIRELIFIFQTYWHSVLMKNRTVEEANSSLFDTLINLITKNKLSSSTLKDFDEIDPLIIKHGKEHGYSILLDRTLPLRECMIWRSEITK